VRRPTPAEIAAARGTTVPDVIGPGLEVLFVGINPSLYSGATGHHFARPGNRFWTALFRAGFSARLLAPDEEESVRAAGLGITNLVARATSSARELTDEELIAGARSLERKVARHRPGVVAIVGITAYRVAFGRRGAQVGPQAETLAGARVWVLPNPSGLNAHYQIDDLSAEFARLRESLS
jgi:TDG/mug DNA glycosylase family protein